MLGFYSWQQTLLMTGLSAGCPASESVVWVLRCKKHILMLSLTRHQPYMALKHTLMYLVARRSSVSEAFSLPSSRSAASVSKAR